MNKKLITSLIILIVILGGGVFYKLNLSNQHDNVVVENDSLFIRKKSVQTEKIEGWQYTKWGMTVDQIIKASDGMARPINSEEQKDCSNPYYYKCIALASYNVGDFEFIVHFRSKLNGTTLNSVNLELVNNEKYESLKSELEAKYGIGAPGSDEIQIKTKWKTDPYLIELSKVEVGGVKIVELNYMDPKDNSNSSL